MLALGAAAGMRVRLSGQDVLTAGIEQILWRVILSFWVGSVRFARRIFRRGTYALCWIAAWGY